MNTSPNDYPVRIWFSPEDRGFVAQALDLPGISAVGDTREDAAREIGVAIGLALATYAEDGKAPPAPGSRQVNEFARKGGMSATRKKRLAAIANGRKGGRPKGSKTRKLAGV